MREGGPRKEFNSPFVTMCKFSFFSYCWYCLNMGVLGIVMHVLYSVNGYTQVSVRFD